MKIQSLLLLFISLLVFNCSSSDDSDNDPIRPEGEIVLSFNTSSSENTIQFSSTKNSFEMPCDFGEINMTTNVTNGNNTFDMLSMNLPAMAIRAGDNFSMNDVFYNHMGYQLIPSVSLRVNNITYVAVSGNFLNVNYDETSNAGGIPLLSCTALLTLQPIEIPGRGVDGMPSLQIRLEIIKVGRGVDIQC